MPDFLAALLIGLAAGIVASGAMEGYQALAAPLFGQDQSGDDSATAKAADEASKATRGVPLPRHRRKPAGRLVHYATGIALGGLYGVLVWCWPPAAIGFGIAFGIAVELVLDEVLVPALGLAPPPWKTPLTTHAYGFTAHIVFAVALEGARRVGWLLAS